MNDTDTMKTVTSQATAVVLTLLGACVCDADDFVSQRPPVADRCFTSRSVEQTIARIQPKIADAELAWMFENCYPNTLDTTVDYEVIDGKPDTFVITGDIDAMWLRDSTAQVWPYMVHLKTDEKLRELVEGLVRRQTKCILRDPYANAFYKDLTKETEWASDTPTPMDGVHERKWEIDSLCYAVRLANEYHRLTGDASVFDDDWRRAARLIVETLRTEQRKQGTPYRFTRETNRMIDAPLFDGLGRPVKPVGLIASAFRPSDDSTLYPFLIPSNLFAVQSLRQLETIFRDIVDDPASADECRAFADEVQAAIEEYAIVEHLGFGEIYAYEVDGFGNRAYWDDANVPSLMSLAYLGVHERTDPLYLRTRKFLLSDNNPYYFRGAAASGQASPHSGHRRIWPMGIILRAMTSTSDDEIVECLRMLKATHAGTGLMHEAFDRDDPSDYTRDWFAWANTLFGELIVQLERDRPHLLGAALE